MTADRYLKTAIEPPRFDGAEEDGTIGDGATSGGTSAGAAADSRAELARRLRQGELLAEFGLFALGDEGEAVLLDQAAHVAARGVGTGYAKVLRHRGSRNDLLLCAGVGWKPGLVGSVTFGVDAFSPAGYAFGAQEAVLTNDLGDETRFRTPRVLREHDIRAAINVPVRVDGKAFGILEADSRDPNHFTPADRAFLTSIATTLGVALGRERARIAASEADERQRLLAGELRHRAKNLFSVVYALIGISEREARANDDVAAGFETLRERVMALSRASDVGTEDDGDGSQGRFDVLALSRTVLAPYEGRIDVSGDGGAVDERWSSPIGLALNELATNASKHGALATEGGRITLEWTHADGAVVGRWHETGGPSVAAPERQGFGTRMVEMVLGQIDGRIERDWRPDGLVATLTLPVDDG